MAPTVLPPANVSRTQPTYAQNNQTSAEPSKVEHQEESVIHHVDTKENQEMIKKDVPNTEGIKLIILY